MKAPLFDRWDFLSTKALLALIAVVSVSVAVIVPIVAWASGRALVWELDSGVGRQPLDSGQVTAKPGTELYWNGETTLSLEDPGSGVWLATLLPGALVALGTVLVGWLLLRLVQRTQAGEPFVESSVTALRLIGATLLVGTVVATVARAAADSAVRDAALATESGITDSLAIGPPLLIMTLGLLVLVVAEAFAHGIRMQQDVAGLV